MRYWVLILAFLSTSSVLAQAYQVGHRQQTFTDANRSNRQIDAEIYYPSTTGGSNATVAAGQFPVLVFGHGFVMAWSAYDVLWDSLVPHGYIMVFPTTESGFFPSHSDFGQDIAFLVNALKTEGNTASSPFFGAVANTSAAMGHSMGGGAAFLAAEQDTNITALATLAAANTSPSSISAAGNVSIPSLVLAGANDCVTPPSQHQIPMYDSLASSCKSYVEITGASHCLFASYNFFCATGEATCSPSATISRATQHEKMIEILLPWLDFYLKGNCQAGIEFQQLMTASSGISVQQNCGLICTFVEPTKTPDLELLVKQTSSQSSIEICCKNAPRGAVIQIYNALGQLVLHEPAEGTVFDLSQANLKQGWYVAVLSHRGRLIDRTPFLMD